jgi:hypothetical protein
VGGNAGIVVVNEENSSNAVVTTATDVITLTVTGPGGYSAAYQAVAVNGVADFTSALTSVTLNNAGQYTYTASFLELNAVATETVNQGAQTTLKVTGVSATAQLYGATLRLAAPVAAAQAG